MEQQLKRILYVEDEEDIRVIVITMLESVGGYTLIPCSSGAQAVDKAPDANADLILLDVMMPGMDGLATLKALRNVPQTAATPVIFMTAKVQASEIAHFRSLGALDVIAKPFDPVTLSAQIGEIWRRRPGAGERARPAPQAASSQASEDALRALYKGYAADLPANIEKIDTLWPQVPSGSEPLALTALHRALHSVAGSGETFGYAQLSRSARTMELALEPYLETKVVPADMLAPLSSMLERLKEAAATPDA